MRVAISAVLISIATLLPTTAEGYNGPGPMEATPYDIAWTKLHGPWVLTWYGGDGDGYLHKKHAATHHGLICPNYNRPGRDIPARVDSKTLAVAMPGPWFYCAPIKVCYQERCIIATAVDSPRDYRLKRKGDWRLYHHIDSWRAVASILGTEDAPVWGDVDVYVGAIVE